MPRGTMASMHVACALLLVVPGFCEPRLLSDAGDLERIGKVAAVEPWAAKVVAGLVREVDEWPELTLTPRFSVVRT